MPGIVGGAIALPVVETRKIEMPEKMPDIVPLNGKIVVKRFEAQNVSKGGITLPEKSRRKPSEGIVIAVGPGRILDNGIVAEPRVKQLDQVLFPQVCGTDVNVDEVEYTILDETEILAVVNGQQSKEIRENAERATMAKTTKKK